MTFWSHLVVIKSELGCWILGPKFATLCKSPGSEIEYGNKYLAIKVGQSLQFALPFLPFHGSSDWHHLYPDTFHPSLAGGVAPSLFLFFGFLSFF